MCVKGSGSVWDAIYAAAITGHSSMAELEEVKHVIGESLVEQALELRAEVDNLSELLNMPRVVVPLPANVEQLVLQLRSNGSHDHDSITDDVVSRIREIIHEECHALKEKIGMLQESVLSTPPPRDRVRSAQKFRQMVAKNRELHRP